MMVLNVVFTVVCLCFDCYLLVSLFCDLRVVLFVILLVCGFPLGLICCFDCCCSFLCELVVFYCCLFNGFGCFWFGSRFAVRCCFSCICGWVIG